MHRIGRTGRAGRTGSAVTLVNHSEKRLVRDIERYTSQTIRIDVIAGLNQPRVQISQHRHVAPSFGDKPKKPFAARGNDRFDGARKASPSTGSKPRTGASASGAPWSGGFRNDGPRTNAGPSRRRFSE